jgi:integrase
MSELLLDAAGRRRSPATLPEFHAGRPPRNKGMRYPADPPSVEEIVAVMRGAGDGVHGRRLRGLIVVLWRAGLRIHEALALAEADLDRRRGSLLVRRGKGGRRREVGMDDWAWEQLEPWLQVRVELPVGPLFCVVNGPTRATAKHRNADSTWRPNDIVDIDALSVAVPYCDVVVAERHSMHVLRQAGASQRFETKLLTSLDQLADHLDVAA